MECVDGTQAHHWDIEASHGSLSNGSCRKCGSVQKFSNSIVTVSSWEAGAKFKRRHQLTNLGRGSKDDNN